MPDISKVILNGVTQMDVTQDTVAPGNLLLNETATMSNGTRTVGTVDLSTYALKAMLAPVEATTTSTGVYNVGDYLICQNDLRVVTDGIGVNQTIDNSNSQVVLMVDELRNAFIALEWSLGANGYEPTGYATTGWANGDRILCGGPQPGLYEVYDISVGDYIPSGPDVISIEVMTSIDGLRTSKANKLSPTFTGTPTAPTAAAGTNTTQIATTAFVHTDLANAIANEILWFSGQTVSAASNAQICRVPSSGTNSAITTNHVVSEVVFGNPAYITSDIGWETHSGYVTFTGTCTAATTVTFQLSRKGN